MHYNGYNYNGKNHSLALKHFVHAAEKGERRAFTALALMYYKVKAHTRPFFGGHPPREAPL